MRQKGWGITVTAVVLVIASDSYLITALYTVCVTKLSWLCVRLLIYNFLNMNFTDKMMLKNIYLSIFSFVVVGKSAHHGRVDQTQGDRLYLNPWHSLLILWAHIHVFPKLNVPLWWPGFVSLWDWPKSKILQLASVLASKLVGWTSHRCGIPLPISP